MSRQKAFDYVSDDELAALGGAHALKGIRCPKCGCTDLRVVYVERQHGFRVRRRECRHCGHRLTTRESPVP
jgi:Zn ribbon nucleic-acid-binding protein